MNTSCEVAFYVLADDAMPAEQLACKLAMMAWEAGHRVHVRTQGEAQAKALDDLMWNIPANRFLPHELGSAGADHAVAIDCKDAAIPENRDLVVNLATSAVPEPGRFSRLLELVPAEEEQRQASREKYKIYRKQGLSPVHHPIKQS